MRRVASLLLALCLLAPGLACAQKTLSLDELRALEIKVEKQLTTYWHLQMLEQEALADGSPERAEDFRRSKLKTYETYMELNAQLKKAQMDRREYEKRQDKEKDTYR